MKDLVLIVLSASLLFITFALPVILRRATARRRAFEKHSDIFFQKLAALAKDPDTPLELLRGFYAMNEMLTMHRYGGVLLLRALLLRPKNVVEPLEKVEFERAITSFVEKRPELGRAFSDGVRAWLQAVLYGASGPWGAFARLLFRNSLSLMDPARVARRVSETKDRHHNGHNGHHAEMAA